MPTPAHTKLTEGADSLARFLREETTGGQILLGATAVALLWANLSAGSYGDVWGTELAVGPGWLHLDLALADWVADGLLAIFFFVVGVEVKRELRAGELADRRAAALPLFAAAGGIAVPALVAIAVSAGAAADGGAWAIPVATDIAFALGILAIAGPRLPEGVRALLLSMAVIDDIAAIAMIAVLFTQGLTLAWLGAAIVPCAAFALVLRTRRQAAWLLWVLAIAAWICVHASGVHATVAGIVLGLVVPVTRRADEDQSPGETLEHRLHPFSAGFVVPLFALATAGIPVAAAGDALGEPIAFGVVAGLLLGKPLGILAGAGLAMRSGLGALPPSTAWRDVVPVAILGGIGYTVSLLISRLAFGDPAVQAASAAAVLIASAASALVAVALLRWRSAAVRDARSGR